jgi:hypothetical protein
MAATRETTPAAAPPAIAPVWLLPPEVGGEYGTMTIVDWIVVVNMSPSTPVDLKECQLSTEGRQSWSIGAYKMRVENTEVNVDVIGGSPELWGVGLAVIVRA